MSAEVLNAGAHLDGVYFCPHVPADECNCRKPRTGMLEQAARELRLDLKSSFDVGDRHSDVELAHRAGARSILVRTVHGDSELPWHAKAWPRQPEFVAADMLDALNCSLKEMQCPALSRP